MEAAPSGYYLRFAYDVNAIRMELPSIQAKFDASAGGSGLTAEATLRLRSLPTGAPAVLFDLYSTALPGDALVNPRVTLSVDATGVLRVDVPDPYGANNVSIVGSVDDCPAVQLVPDTAAGKGWTHVALALGTSPDASLSPANVTLSLYVAGELCAQGLVYVYAGSPFTFDGSRFAAPAAAVDDGTFDVGSLLDAGMIRLWGRELAACEVSAVRAAVVADASLPLGLVADFRLAATSDVNSGSKAVKNWADTSSPGTLAGPGVASYASCLFSYALEFGFGPLDSPDGFGLVHGDAVDRDLTKTPNEPQYVTGKSAAVVFQPTKAGKLVYTLDQSAFRATYNGGNFSVAADCRISNSFKATLRPVARGSSRIVSSPGVNADSLSMIQGIDGPARLSVVLDGADKPVFIMGPAPTLLIKGLDSTGANKAYAAATINQVASFRVDDAGIDCSIPDSSSLTKMASSWNVPLFCEKPYTGPAQLQADPPLAAPLRFFVKFFPRWIFLTSDAEYNSAIDKFIMNVGQTYTFNFVPTVGDTFVPVWVYPEDFKITYQGTLTASNFPFVGRADSYNLASNFTIRMTPTKTGEGQFVALGRQKFYDGAFKYIIFGSPDRFDFSFKSTNTFQIVTVPGAIVTMVVKSMSRANLPVKTIVDDSNNVGGNRFLENVTMALLPPTGESWTVKFTIPRGDDVWGVANVSSSKPATVQPGLVYIYEVPDETLLEPYDGELRGRETGVYAYIARRRIPMTIHARKEGRITYTLASNIRPRGGGVLRPDSLSALTPDPNIVGYSNRFTFTMTMPNGTGRATLYCFPAYTTKVPFQFVAVEYPDDISIRAGTQIAGGNTYRAGTSFAMTIFPKTYGVQVQVASTTITFNATGVLRASDLSSLGLTIANRFVFTVSVPALGGPASLAIGPGTQPPFLFAVVETPDNTELLLPTPRIAMMAPIPYAPYNVTNCTTVRVCPPGPPPPVNCTAVCNGNRANCTVPGCLDCNLACNGSLATCTVPGCLNCSLACNGSLANCTFPGCEPLNCSKVCNGNLRNCTVPGCLNCSLACNGSLANCTIPGCRANVSAVANATLANCTGVGCNFTVVANATVRVGTLRQRPVNCSLACNGSLDNCTVPGCTNVNCTTACNGTLANCTVPGCVDCNLACNGTLANCTVPGCLDCTAACNGSLLGCTVPGCDNYYLDFGPEPDPCWLEERCVTTTILRPPWICPVFFATPNPVLNFTIVPKVGNRTVHSHREDVAWTASGALTPAELLPIPTLAPFGAAFAFSVQARPSDATGFATVTMTPASLAGPTVIGIGDVPHTTELVGPQPFDVDRVYAADSTVRITLTPLRNGLRIWSLNTTMNVTLSGVRGAVGLRTPTFSDSFVFDVALLSDTGPAQLATVPQMHTNGTFQFFVVAPPTSGNLTCPASLLYVPLPPMNCTVTPKRNGGTVQIPSRAVLSSASESILGTRVPDPPYPYTANSFTVSVYAAETPAPAPNDGVAAGFVFATLAYPNAEPIVLAPAAVRLAFLPDDTSELRCAFSDFDTAPANNCTFTARRAGVRVQTALALVVSVEGPVSVAWTETPATAVGSTAFRFSLRSVFPGGSARAIVSATNATGTYFVKDLAMYTADRPTGVNVTFPEPLFPGPVYAADSSITVTVNPMKGATRIWALNTAVNFASEGLAAAFGRLEANASDAWPLQVNLSSDTGPGRLRFAPAAVAFYPPAPRANVTHYAVGVPDGGRVVCPPVFLLYDTSVNCTLAAVRWGAPVFVHASAVQGLVRESMARSGPPVSPYPYVATNFTITYRAALEPALPEAGPARPAFGVADGALAGVVPVAPAEVELMFEPDGTSGVDCAPRAFDVNDATNCTFVARRRGVPVRSPFPLAANASGSVAVSAQWGALAGPANWTYWFVARAGSPSGGVGRVSVASQPPPAPVCNSTASAAANATANATSPPAVNATSPPAGASCVARLREPVPLANATLVVSVVPDASSLLNCSTNLTWVGTPFVCDLVPYFNGTLVYAYLEQLVVDWPYQPAAVAPPPRWPLAVATAGSITVPVGSLPEPNTVACTGWCEMTVRSARGRIGGAGALVVGRPYRGYSNLTCQVTELDANATTECLFESGAPVGFSVTDVNALRLIVAPPNLATATVRPLPPRARTNGFPAVYSDRFAVTVRSAVQLSGAFALSMHPLTRLLAPLPAVGTVQFFVSGMEIASVQPQFGNVLGGLLVTIGGVGFPLPPEPLVVEICDTEAGLTTRSSTTIVLELPALSGENLEADRRLCNVSVSLPARAFVTPAVAVDAYRYNIAPVAAVLPVQLSADGVLVLPASVQLNASASLDPDTPGPAERVLSFKWSLASAPDDAGGVEIAGSEGAAATAGPLYAAGDYRFKLVVTDSAGDVGTAFVNFTAAFLPSMDLTISLEYDFKTFLRQYVDSEEFRQGTKQATAEAFNVDESQIAGISLAPGSVLLSTSISATSTSAASAAALAGLTRSYTGSAYSKLLGASVTSSIVRSAIKQKTANKAPTAKITVVCKSEDMGSGSWMVKANACTLDGNESSDPDGFVSTFTWRLLEPTAECPIGPGTPAWVDGGGSGRLLLVVPGLTGACAVGLTVADNDGLASGAMDQVTLVLTGKTGNDVPVLAVEDKTITIDPEDGNYDNTTTATLAGVATDPDGLLAAASWAQVDGPSVQLDNVSWVDAASGPAQVAEVVSRVRLVGLGTWSFQLNATDDDGATVANVTSITVVMGPPPPSTDSVDATAAKRTATAFATILVCFIGLSWVLTLIEALTEKGARFHLPLANTATAGGLFHVTRFQILASFGLLTNRSMPASFISFCEGLYPYILVVKTTGGDPSPQNVRASPVAMLRRALLYSRERPATAGFQSALLISVVVLAGLALVFAALLAAQRWGKRRPRGELEARRRKVPIADRLRDALAPAPLLVYLAAFLPLAIAAAGAARMDGGAWRGFAWFYLVLAAVFAVAGVQLLVHFSVGRDAVYYDRAVAIWALRHWTAKTDFGDARLAKMVEAAEDYRAREAGDPVSKGRKAVLDRSPRPDADSNVFGPRAPRRKAVEEKQEGGTLPSAVDGVLLDLRRADELASAAHAGEAIASRAEQLEIRSRRTRLGMLKGEWMLARGASDGLQTFALTVAPLYAPFKESRSGYMCYELAKALAWAACLAAFARPAGSAQPGGYDVKPRDAFTQLFFLGAVEVVDVGVQLLWRPRSSKWATSLALAHSLLVLALLAALVCVVLKSAWPFDAGRVLFVICVFALALQLVDQVVDAAASILRLVRRRAAAAEAGDDSSEAAAVAEFARAREIAGREGPSSARESPRGSVRNTPRGGPSPMGSPKAVTLIPQPAAGLPPLSLAPPQPAPPLDAPPSVYSFGGGSRLSGSSPRDAAGLRPSEAGSGGGGGLAGLPRRASVPSLLRPPTPPARPEAPAAAPGSAPAADRPARPHSSGSLAPSAAGTGASPPRPEAPPPSEGPPPVEYPAPRPITPPAE